MVRVGQGVPGGGDLAPRLGDLVVLPAARGLEPGKPVLGVGELRLGVALAHPRLLEGPLDARSLDRHGCKRLSYLARPAADGGRRGCELVELRDLRRGDVVASLQLRRCIEDRFVLPSSHAGIIARRRATPPYLESSWHLSAEESVRPQQLRAGHIEGRAMHARMATYRFSGDAHDLAQRAEQGMLPVFQAQPGFRAYSLAVDGGEILSLSVWDSRPEAEAGSAAAAEWVRENMPGQIELTDTRYAEVLLSTSLGLSAAVGARA